MKAGTRFILALALVLLVVSVLLLSAGGSHATTAHRWDERIISRGPVHCGPISCHQVKVVTFYTHGRPPLTLTWRHKRPSESRDTYTIAAWESWQLVSVRQGGPA